MYAYTRNAREGVPMPPVSDAGGGFFSEIRSLNRVVGSKQTPRSLGEHFQIIDDSFEIGGHLL